MGGTPIEEAPLWVLAIATVLLWLVIFPGLVGVLNGFRLQRGGGWAVAAAAAGIAILLVAGLATRKPWKRDRVSGRFDHRPLLVRFSTWLIATLFVPNVLFGVIVLSQGGESLDYAAAWLLGLLVSALHGAFALADWLRRRARPGPPP